MNYIIHCLDELGCDYRVYSTCQIIDKKHCAKQIEGNVVYRDSFATTNKYTFWLDRFWAIIQLVCYLLSVSNKDTILVYHERFYTKYINLVSKLKKWKIVWEVEEIYTMVHGNNPKEVEREIKGLNRISSNRGGYILATQLLKKYFNGKIAVCNGVYDPINFKDETGHKSEIIHVIYGGTLNKTKGGATAAAAAAKFLDQKYHVHILGFGNATQISSIRELIDNVSKTSLAKVTYDGLLRGPEYSDFLASCDIGLSTQNPDADYNDTSFPSKILEYLRNGVNVVSIDIPAVRTSGVSPLISFYKNQNPQELATAIKNARIHTKEEIKEHLSLLHEGFKEGLKELLHI